MRQATKQRKMSEELLKMIPREDFQLEQNMGIYRLKPHKIPKLELKLVVHHTEVRCAIHGTHSRNWNSIKSEGISKMRREYIHFAQGETGVKSGFPPYCDMAIEIDVEKAMRDGIKFYISENDVVLTKGRDGYIPNAYFKKAYKLGTRENLPL
ncbi:tRNA 2'-phosphotransferase 1-like isoform X4 [Crassostrea virginica]